jgi:hypothetical protein
MNGFVDRFLEFLNQALGDFETNKQFSVFVECESKTIEILDGLIEAISLIHTEVSSRLVNTNCIFQYEETIQSAIETLTFRGFSSSDFDDSVSDSIKNIRKKDLDRNSKKREIVLEQIKFKSFFFSNAEYFTKNLVVIGSNGAGKTLLSNKLKDYLGNSGVSISAQRLLFVPNFDSIPNPSHASSELRSVQMLDKANKDSASIKILQREFEVVLKNLLAENISKSHNYRSEAIKSTLKGGLVSKPQWTNLDLTLKIWNSLNPQRSLKCIDGMNIVAFESDKSSYDAAQMSDGEKVMLYLIAQVIQAPTESFVIIDEPEMYLHKTVLKKLWNELEALREDCIFIYLTHDLDFASSRNGAKKIWIKSFRYPDKWDIEGIPSDIIPESLMLELLGSRRNILFCEGTKGKTDESIYSILFPGFTVIPVAGCFNVINYTKSFNKIESTNVKAFGLIDSDHHDADRLKKLKESNIYNIQMPEIENIFLDSLFLKELANQIMVDEIEVDKIKSSVINTLKKDLEVQASNYVSTEVNNFFTDSDIVKANTKEDLQKNYDAFVRKISIEKLYKERIDYLEQIIKSEDYNRVISCYNNKGLQSVASKYLKITDFIERSLKLIQINKESRRLLHRYFPQEILDIGLME